MTNAVLWLEVVVFAIFVGLRLYTRIRLLDAVGADAFSFAYFLVLDRVPRPKGHLHRHTRWSFSSNSMERLWMQMSSTRLKKPWKN
jgi:hypothetical protein